MSHRFRRSWAVAPLVACAAVLGPVTAAQASDASLRTTIKAAAPKIDRSQAKILDGIAHLDQTKSATALIKAVKAQDKDLASLQSKLNGESASSAAGTKGKSDVIKGLGLILKSNTTLIADIQAGKKLTKAEVKTIDNEAVKGNKAAIAGQKLLKV
jgi:hypothetical protein